MENTDFLAQLIGLMMMLIGVIILIRPGHLRLVTKEYLQSPAMLFVAGIVAMALGLSIILTHNIWAWDHRGLITLIGWIFVFAGFTRSAMPDVLVSLGDKILDRHGLIVGLAAVMTALGAYLAWQGFA